MDALLAAAMLVPRGRLSNGPVKPAAPRPVGDLLAAAVPGLEERLTAHAIRRTWPALVGPEVARRAQPQALAGGCLHVRVDNSPWLQELTLRSADLTARVQRAFPAVRSLRFVVGPLEEPPAGPRLPRRPRLEPDPGAAEEIEAAVRPITDAGAAAAARRLLTTAWRSVPNPRGAAE